MSTVLLCALVVFAYSYGFYRGKKQAKPALEPQTKTYEFEVEAIGDCFYAYDLGTGLFLGQNKNIQELAMMVRDKVPGYQIYAALSKDNPNDTV